METVEIICRNCDIKFNKSKKEVDRQRKNGRNYFYCSRSCVGKYNIVRNRKNLGDKLGDISHMIPFTVDEFSQFKPFLRRVKVRHIESDKPYDIDLAYIKEIWDMQMGLCSITKVPLILETSVTNPNYSASLDRIDSNKGYIKGNIQFISVTTNYAKNQYSTENIKEYFEIIKNMN